MQFNPDASSELYCQGNEKVEKVVRMNDAMSNFSVEERTFPRFSTTAMF